VAHRNTAVAMARCWGALSRWRTVSAATPQAPPPSAVTKLPAPIKTAANDPAAAPATRIPAALSAALAVSTTRMPRRRSTGPLSSSPMGTPRPPRPTASPSVEGDRPSVRTAKTTSSAWYPDIPVLNQTLDHSTPRSAGARPT
jgi:hypothetical protein